MHHVLAWRFPVRSAPGGLGVLADLPKRPRREQRTVSQGESVGQSTGRHEKDEGQTGTAGSTTASIL